MITRDKIIISALIAIVFAGCIYLIRSILAPFIFSFVVAYFLHPLVGRLSQKMSRANSALLIIGLFFAVFAAISYMLLPIIYQQASALILSLPQYFQIIVSEIYPKCAAILNEAGIAVNADLVDVLNKANISSRIINFLENFALNAVSSSVAFVNILSLIFITPILIFYLVKDWNILVEKINNYLPSRIADSSKKIMNEIDEVLSGYIRGQINVCLVLALIYSILLSVAGLNFGFLIGIITGFLTFIPYVGALTGFVVAMFVAFFQWGFDFMSLLTIALVFVFGQMLESNYLTPKLIGKKVGLHPVWIVFGLFVFGVIFGFIGVLLATPLTAVCGVLIRHLSWEYKKRIT